MKKDTVVILDGHIELLRNAYVRWDNCEFGAPAIDSKRPYGNSDVIGDMRDILGEGHSDGDLITLHKELEVALQIFLQMGKMETGIYSRSTHLPYRWVKQ